MSESLRDLLRQGADTVERPQLNMDELVARTERRLVRRRLAAVAASAAVVVLVAAAGFALRPDDERLAPAPAPTETENPPAVGTCWAMPSEDAVDPGYWFESPQVPCTEPHTTETAAVLELSEPTIAEAKKRADNCSNHVHAYLGIDLSAWVHWGYVALLPSREQVAAGASWMRCEAIFPEWDYSSIRTTTDTAALVAIDPPADLWACLDEHPQKANQLFVPCDQPHQYEQTGTQPFLELFVDEYPTPAELAAAARRQCADAIPEAGENIAFTARWDPPSVAKEFTEIGGACFMFDKTGQPLAPRP